MLETTGHLQLALPQLGRFHKELWAQVWTTVGGPLAVRQSTPNAEHLPVAGSAGVEYRPIKIYPYIWGNEFDQCFWQLDIPADYADGSHYLRWTDQGEATVFTADLAPLYGFDPGHEACPVPKGTTQLIIESICCRSGVWVTGGKQGITNQGSVFNGAYVMRRNDDAWAAFFDVDVLLGLARYGYARQVPLADDPLNPGRFRPPLEKLTPTVRRIFRGLTAAATTFYTAGPKAVRQTLAPLFRQLREAGGLGVDLVLTGHAHIDLVWLWTERTADFKAVHSFANAISVKQRYPEITFGYSQPASYEAVARRSPQVDRQVRRAIKDGWWEATGATYVESDTQLACGEALLRAFELGQAGLRDLSGQNSTVLWLPDVFGYSPCIPQLMLGFGVPYFYTTKMFWSNATKLPFSSFRWVGHDGSEVLAHVSHQFYNNDGLPDHLNDYVLNHRQSDVHAEALAPIGYGDGGGGVNDAMCERVQRLNGLSEAPGCKWGRIDEFFDRLSKLRDQLPAWHGEMYLEFHQGVQTSISQLKANFRRAERSLQRLEAAALAATGPVDEHAWKRVVFAQFHDYIPGSSVRNVYEEALPELAAIADSADARATELLGGDTRAGDKPPTSLFNPTGLRQIAWTGEQWVSLPPWSVTPVHAAHPLTAGVGAGSERLTSDRVDAEFAGDGTVTALTIDGVPIAMASPLNQPWLLEDRPAQYDAWNIDRATLSAGQRLAASKPTIIDCDGLVGVRFELAFGQSSGSITYALVPGTPALEVEIDLQFQEPSTLLKASFPTRYHGMNAATAARSAACCGGKCPGRCGPRQPTRTPPAAGPAWAMTPNARASR